MDWEQKHYLIQSGDILESAQDYRSGYTSFRAKMWDYLKSIGAVSFQDNFANGLGRVRFEGEAPEGFTKPNKYGCCRPKVKSSYEAEFEKFKAGPDPLRYLEGKVDLVRQVSYKEGEAWGSRCVGHPITPYGIYWYAKDGPLLLITPDVEKAINNTKKEHPKAVVVPEKWNPPIGCLEIMPEEWDLMKAKHKKQEAA